MLTISQDSITQRGLEKAKRLLEEGPVMGAGVHKGRFDVLGDGRTLAKLGFERAIVPSSYANLERSGLDKLWHELGKHGVHFYPTYRSAPYVPDNERLVANDMDPEDRAKINAEWVLEAKKAIEDAKKAREDGLSVPRTVIYVAVYGGMNKPSGGLPKGVVEVLRAECPVLPMLTVCRKRLSEPMETYASDKILRFRPDTGKDEMYDKILLEHRKLAAGANIYRDYFGNV